MLEKATWNWKYMESCNFLLLSLSLKLFQTKKFLKSLMISIKQQSVLVSWNVRRSKQHAVTVYSEAFKMKEKFEHWDIKVHNGNQHGMFKSPSLFSSSSVIIFLNKIDSVLLRLYLKMVVKSCSVIFTSLSWFWQCGLDSEPTSRNCFLHFFQMSEKRGTNLGEF